MSVDIIWTDRRGRGHVRRIGAPETVTDVIGALKTLRSPARVLAGEALIGGIEYRPGEFDDRRIKWWWWLDADDCARALAESGGAS